MCPSASQPRKNQPGKDQFPKSQSQKSQQPEPAQSYDPSSFSDTFRAMARESLVKNQKNRPDSPIVSISTGLIVLLACCLSGVNQIRTQTIKTIGIIAFESWFHLALFIRLLVVFVTENCIVSSIINCFVET